MGDNSTHGHLRALVEAPQSESGGTTAAIEVPTNDGPLDHPGPYEEEPAAQDASQPKYSMRDWNSTSHISFCEHHKTGFWCNGFTRVRCCKLQDGDLYAQCGSTANSTGCGSNGDVVVNTHNVTNATFASSWWPGYDSRRRYGGSGWHIHPGWHTSSYCESHHVGTFCSSHRIIHCCNDHGHYVECNTQYHHSSWWC